MRILQSYIVLAVVFAICFAVTVPLFVVFDTHDNFELELFETDEENQTEHEENQEELADDDFKNDLIYSAFLDDSSLKGQFTSNKEVPDIIFKDPSSPPPEHS